MSRVPVVKVVRLLFGFLDVRLLQWLPLLLLTSCVLIVTGDADVLSLCRFVACVSMVANENRVEVRVGEGELILRATVSNTTETHVHT